LIILQTKRHFLLDFIKNEESRLRTIAKTVFIVCSLFLIIDINERLF